MNVQLTLGLDEIAAEIHRVWDETKAHQVAAWEGYFTTGHLLLEARDRFGDDDKGFGRWRVAQKFGFNRQWAQKFMAIVRREGEARLLTSALVSRPPGVDAVYDSLYGVAARDRQARRIAAGGADAGSERWRILTGDFRDRIAEIPDAAVHLILTDPPYPEEFADLWSALAEHAKRVLRPGGIVAALSGKIHVDDRMRRLGEHLAYGWIYAELLPGSHTRILARHVAQEWKPWLGYSNGPWPSGLLDWHGDLLPAGPRAKDEYAWQQAVEPAIALIERLSSPDDVVLDPFCGSGTYGVAAIRTGRRFIGIEADVSRVATATDRLHAETARA